MRRGRITARAWAGCILDGLDIRVPGLTTSPIIQPASLRTVDYTVPFGAFGGVGARGFELTATDFDPAPQSTLDQLSTAGRVSFSPVQQKTTALETFAVGGANYDIRIAALYLERWHDELRHPAVL